MNKPTGKVSEIIVRVNDHPVYSGSEHGARAAIQSALTRCHAEGREEPQITVTRRTVDYDLPDIDPAKVQETNIEV